jgi:hypothetical protein
MPYVEVCVLGETGYWSEGFGFTLYNYKTNNFSMKPYTVFPPSTEGTKIPTTQEFGSPVIKNGKVTFYSWQCCAAGPSIYTTTKNATLAALKNPASYSPVPADDLPATFSINVGRPSKYHAKYTMYILRGTDGEYAVYAAPGPTGPWTEAASGQLPGCAGAPHACRSFALHPELSPSKRLMVSYYLHGFGPGIATKHPSNKQPHAVMASVPCNC